MLEDVISRHALRAAFERVHQRSGCRGSDGVTVGDFARDLEVQLDRLEGSLRLRNYHPLPLLRVAIPKRDGQKRFLSIPAVRDRVVQTAAYLATLPLFEAELEEVSFAFRPGRSVRSALHRVAERHGLDPGARLFPEAGRAPALFRGLAARADHAASPARGRRFLRGALPPAGRAAGEELARRRSVFGFRAAMLIVVSYDIEDDRRRARLAKALEGFGERVQFSVFEVRLHGASIEHLRDQIETELDPKAGSVRMYRFCEACAGKVEVLGEGRVTEDPDVYIV